MFALQQSQLILDKSDSQLADRVRIEVNLSHIYIEKKRYNAMKKIAIARGGHFVLSGTRRRKIFKKTRLWSLCGILQTAKQFGGLCLLWLSKRKARVKEDVCNIHQTYMLTLIPVSTYHPMVSHTRPRTVPALHTIHAQLSPGMRLPTPLHSPGRRQ
jgi:hypothetical protein